MLLLLPFAVVQEGVSNVSPNQPLAAIVPEEADIQPFLDALKANPRAIEGETSKKKWSRITLR